MTIRYYQYAALTLAGLGVGVGFSLSLTGCGSLLPHGKEASDLPWATYEVAQQAYASIVPEKTTLADLHKMGIDPKDTPNVALVNHADLSRKLVASSTIDIKMLAPKVRTCIASPMHCYGYEIEQKHLDRTRHGNFLLDILNFKRDVQISGWQFDALLVIQDGVVVYKLWSGKANIQQQEEEHNPLGPLQTIGSPLNH
jgi:hypothetical protein